MKKNLLLFIATVFLLTSCSSNENENLTEAINLIGDWYLTAQTLNATFTITEGTETATFTSNAVGKDFNFKITFLENPKTIAKSGSFNVKTTSSATGEPDQVEESTINSEDGFFAGSWSLSGTTLTITNSENEVRVGELTIIDENTLSFIASYQETETDGNLTINAEVVFQFTIER